MQDQLDKQTVISKTLIEQADARREEHTRLVQEEQGIETRLPQHSRYMTDIREDMLSRIQTELKGQFKDNSVVISELQKEVKEQSTVIKQQAAVMEKLQAAVVRQTEMFSEQQRLMKESW